MAFSSTESTEELELNAGREEEKVCKEAPCSWSANAGMGREEALDDSSGPCWSANVGREEVLDSSGGREAASPSRSGCSSSVGSVSCQRR